MDNSILEYTAEDLIAHKLQRSGILVAKPKFDNIGADLLAFLAVSDGAKFCRIQCKGRTVRNTAESSVNVPCDYVTDGFVLFLFVETGNKDTTLLYCFLANDITEYWKLTKDKKQFRLRLNGQTFQTDLSNFLFDETKIAGIISVIKGVDNSDDFDLLQAYRKYMAGEEGIVWSGYPADADQIVDGLARSTGKHRDSVRHSLDEMADQQRL